VLKTGGGGGANLQKADDGDFIPQPIRVKKPKKQQLTSSSENLTSEEGQELLDRSKQSNDQVRSSQSSTSMDVKKRQQATSNQYVDEEELLEAKDKRARPKPSTASKPAGGKNSAPPGQPPPSPGEAQRLRVHVKTAPGATVRIHQGPASSLQPQAAYADPHNKSGSSRETDF